LHLNWRTGNGALDDFYAFLEVSTTLKTT
jgi:hypothetical protein